MPAASLPIRLSKIDLIPILSEATIGRMTASAIPELMNKVIADPDAARMFMQLSHILLALGQHEFALEMQAKAVETGSLYRIEGSATPAIRLLAFMAMGDNMSLDFLVENSDIGVDLIFLSPGQRLPDIIPDHDIAIIAIRESDKTHPLLAEIEALLPHWPRPVLNRPRSIAHCARDKAYSLLKDIPGLRVPETRKLEREELSGSRFPVTMRPVDTHGGKGLAKLDAASEFAAYLESHADPEFYLSDYVDYRSADGLYRKYRIALIDAKPYLCHVAISDHWMVHYLSSGMQASVAKRAEEAALMDSFDSDFAIRHRATFNEIAKRLALDYVVIDCGEMPDGRMLWFEADNGGWVHSVDSVEIFPYKPKTMQKTFDAFRAMLAKYAG